MVAAGAGVGILVVKTGNASEKIRKNRERVGRV
jgi:hypothetical protein